MFREKTNRRKKRTQKTSNALLFSTIAFIIVITGLPFLFTKHHFALTAYPGWNPKEVQVTNTRIVTAYATDASQSHPATFYYRAEAEVQYQVNGKKFDVWLPASRVTANLVELQMWLSNKKGRFATVLWNPDKPGEGQVKLKSDIGTSFAEFD
jgi:hypothetical protein